MWKRLTHFNMHFYGVCWLHFGVGVHTVFEIVLILPQRYFFVYFLGSSRMYIYIYIYTYIYVYIYT